MSYPTYQVYEKIYSRFLLKGPEIFFSKQSPKGLVVTDLCSGGGIVTRYALSHGAIHVNMVENEEKMMPKDLVENNRTTWFGRDVEYFLKEMDTDRADIITCRQGVNYWLKHVDTKNIAKKLVKGGMFVFNTFGNKPPERPKVREYFHGGRAYCEVSYCVGDVVHHIQAVDGFEPHVTSFDWLSDEFIREKLNSHFDCEVSVDKASSMWYCIAK